jgi:hypothetical protein
MNPYFTKEMPTPLPIYELNDSHSVLIGNRYLVKVDSVLRCPVFGPNDSQVYDIDNILATFYDCSDGEDSQDSEDSESDGSSEGDGEGREGDGEGREGDGSNEDSEGSDQVNVLATVEDAEFEIIEDAK